MKNVVLKTMHQKKENILGLSVKRVGKTIGFNLVILLQTPKQSFQKGTFSKW